MINLEKKFITTENGKIFYFSRIISKDRPTVLLLHGLSSNHTAWFELMETLDKNGINSLAPDLRGHGFSDKTKKKELYKFPVFKNDVELIVKKEGLDGVHLIGYSFGGYIGMDFAAANPLSAKSLILISANHVNPLKYTPFSFLTPAAHALLDTLALLLIWQKREQYHYFDQRDPYGYWESTLKGLTTMPLSINFWMLSEVLRLNLKNSVDKIKCPTLIMHGKNDPFVTEAEVNDMAAKISDCRVVHLEDSGHYLALHYQEKIAEETLKFLHQVL